MKFARVGGLGATKQQGYGKDSFHSPPAKYGRYAFIWPYFELFLVMWSKSNKKDFEVNGFRVFEYDGPIWCHLDTIKSSYIVGSWVKTDTYTLERFFPKFRHSELKEMHSANPPLTPLINFKKTTGFINPYKFYSKDHLEVFIEHIK